MVPCGDFDLLTDQFEHASNRPLPPRHDRKASRCGLLRRRSFVPFQTEVGRGARPPPARLNEWSGAYAATSRRMAASARRSRCRPRRPRDRCAAELGYRIWSAQPYRRRTWGCEAYDPVGSFVERGLTLGARGARHPRRNSAPKLHSFADGTRYHTDGAMAAMASAVPDGALERHRTAIAFSIRNVLLRNGSPLDQSRGSHRTGGGPECSPSPAVSSEVRRRGGAGVERMGADYVMWGETSRIRRGVPGRPRFPSECEAQATRTTPGSYVGHALRFTDWPGMQLRRRAVRRAPRLRVTSRQPCRPLDFLDGARNRIQCEVRRVDELGRRGARLGLEQAPRIETRDA